MILKHHVKIALPRGEEIQRCLWHLLQNAQKLVEKRYPQKRAAKRRSQIMGMVREVLTSPSEGEAMARFRALAKEDGLLARYLFPRAPVRKPRRYPQGVNDVLDEFAPLDNPPHIVVY